MRNELSAQSIPSRSVIIALLPNTEDCEMPNLKGIAEAAFQGELGAYSESAVYKYFGSEVKPKTYRRSSDVFDEVNADAADFGAV